MEKLRSSIRNCLSNRSERELIVQRAVNRRGRSIECTVSVNCLMGNGTTRGVILMMDAVLLDDPARQDGQSGQADGQVQKPAEKSAELAPAEADGRANRNESAG